MSENPDRDMEDVKDLLKEIKTLLGVIAAKQSYPVYPIVYPTTSPTIKPYPNYPYPNTYPGTGTDPTKYSSSMGPADPRQYTINDVQSKHSHLQAYNETDTNQAFEELYGARA